MALSVTYDQGFSGRFDNVFGEANKCVDAQDTFDLNEQSVEQAEVAARDTNDGGVGEVVHVERSATCLVSVRGPSLENFIVPFK